MVGRFVLSICLIEDHENDDHETERESDFPWLEATASAEAESDDSEYDHGQVCHMCLQYELMNEQIILANNRGNVNPQIF